MDRRLALDDQAASQIIGFIVGLTVVTASLAIATYFIVTVPETGADEESQQLQGATHRAAETLTTTPGQPADWGENFDKDELRRVGLLEPGTHAYADTKKIQRIQEGNVTGPDILNSWNLDASTTGLRIEGNVQTVPLGDTPTVETYGVVHGEASLSSLDWNVATHSSDAAKLYADVTDGYAYEEHFWELGAQDGPDVFADRLGTTVPDHAWFVETQLIPKLTGIEATYSTADHGTGDWKNTQARVDAFRNYTGAHNGGPDSATRWHVIADGEPYGFPGTPPPEIKDHALSVNWRMTNNGGGSESNGVGLWRTSQGARTTALLGGFDTGGADTGSMAFDHYLRVNDEELDLCQTPDDQDCDMVRPSILFWNATADRWSRLAEEAKCGSSGWNDTATSQNTTKWGNTGELDLCEALTHSDDTLWLSLMWDTDCIDGDGNNETCKEADNGEYPKVSQGWWVDNINITIDGTLVYQNDFEPPDDGGRQALFVSNGVDHNRTYTPGPDDAEANTVAYIKNMVQDGNNVVALSPEDAPPGDWLAAVGLSSAGTSPSSDVTVEEPGSIMMNYPNELPETSPDYRRENVTWLSHPNVTYTKAQLDTTGRQNLTVVQSGPDGNATLLQGTPYPGGGQVAALARNYTNFANETLREELWENVHASSVFSHPNFEVGDELPEPGTSEVSSARRVMLVDVTAEDRYIVPLEVTIWMWNRG